MDADPIVMRSDDERREPLQRASWTIEARSWGAQLDAEQVDRSVLQQQRDNATSAVTVRELDAADLPVVLDLDTATVNDYPGGIATQHAPLVAERATPSPTRRGFGAFGETGALVAMTWVDVDGTTAETDFTVVRASERGHGFATAVKAASLLALLDAGVTRFRTGGSSENAGIIATNRGFGYVRRGVDHAQAAARALLAATQKCAHEAPHIPGREISAGRLPVREFSRVVG